MFINWILALSPILLILVLMLRFRWSAAKAGPVGWLVAMIVAWGRFGASLDLLAVVHGKALLLTLDVLMIVWAAFLLYRVADEAGAVRMLCEVLPRWTSDRGMQALLIGWPFASFLQGVGGFGVPTAVTAPLLVGLGFSPITAVVVPSIGHAWSVTFGSLASSFQALMAATGISGEQLAPMAALLLGLVGVASGFLVLHASSGWRSMLRLAMPIIMVGTAMASAQYWLAVNGFWHIAGFGGGLVGLAIGLYLARRRQIQQAEQNPIDLEIKTVFYALASYIALILITLVIQFSAPLHEVLSGIVIQVSFPELTTSHGFSTPAGFGRIIYPLRHAGAILTYASIVSYILYRRQGLYANGATKAILQGTVRGVVKSSLSIATMVAMAVVMAHAGMTDNISRGLAESVGSLFPLISPWIGALGAFITGSNTNANVIFSLLQLRTAEMLNFRIPLILAAQTTGGAIGSVIAPTKIVVGASTAGMTGSEGTILRKLLGYMSILLVGVSGMVWMFSKLGPR